MKPISRKLFQKVRRRLKRIYGDQHPMDLLEERLFRSIGRYGVGRTPPVAPRARWDENEVVLITYADIVQKKGEAPLRTLRRFCSKNIKGAVRTVHLLPFYPWSSDDGFSVIDYREVKDEYGKWDDVRALGNDFRLMFDLVLNHCSSKSRWFQDFVSGIAPEKYYFIEMDPETDLSDVVRPRTSPLLRKVTTREGTRHVWTTFSADQVDLNWSNPDVLFEFIDILFLYISMGMRIVRLDAVAFAWKEIGTDCIHRPETHELVKFLRDITELVAPHVTIITETNVPHKENISYFGAGDEAHMVYNFSLPPLLLHGLLTNNATHLTDWAAKQTDTPKGCTYFNFTASHDGIGVRPLQGLLDDGELNKLVQNVRERGGFVNMRRMPDGSEKPYELNITYRDALSVPGDEKLSTARFLCSQAVMLSFKGVPAIYFHSLVGTPNYIEGVKETGQNRTINRRKYDEKELSELLNEEDSAQSNLFQKYLTLLRRRRNHPAFHPDGEQIVHQGGQKLFILERIAPDKSEKILCVFNFTDKEQILKNSAAMPIMHEASNVYDLISAKRYTPNGKKGLKLAPYQAMWLTPRD